MLGGFSERSLPSPHIPAIDDTHAPPPASSVLSSGAAVWRMKNARKQLEEGILSITDALRLKTVPKSDSR